MATRGRRPATTATSSGRRGSSARGASGSVRRKRAPRVAGKEIAPPNRGRQLEDELAQLRTANDELHKSLRQVLHIASDEQRRVGQELHDVVLQDLTGLSLLADAARNNVVPSGPAQELVNKLVGGLRRLNVKVRALCEGLAPPEIEVGDLKAALQALAETTSRAHGLAISVEAEQLAAIDRHTAHQLYRIVQEALVDIVRYSQASVVIVHLSEQQAGEYKLEISDDGIGSDETKRRRGGPGARIMQYRCALLGGRLQVWSRPEGGSVTSCAFTRSLLTDEPDS